MTFFENNISALFCPKPDEIENAEITCTKRYKLGSLCTYTCKKDWTLYPFNHSGILCYKTSKWIGFLSPLCLSKLVTQLSRIVFKKSFKTSMQFSQVSLIKFIIHHSYNLLIVYEVQFFL